MNNANERQTVQTLWESNYLNIRRATQTCKATPYKKLVVATELYNVCVDTNNNFYPWAKEALQFIASKPCFSFYIWTIYGEKYSSWIYNNLFAPNKINAKGINEGFYLFGGDYSTIKPVIDVSIDISSGFDNQHWYWIYQLFRVSDGMLNENDNSAIRVIRDKEQFSIRPTTVRIKNDIPVAKPVTPRPK